MDAQWWTATTVRDPLTAPTHPTAVLSGTFTAKKFWFERQWQPSVKVRRTRGFNRYDTHTHTHSLSLPPPTHRGSHGACYTCVAAASAGARRGGREVREKTLSWSPQE